MLSILIVEKIVCVDELETLCPDGFKNIAIGNSLARCPLVEIPVEEGVEAVWNDRWLRIV